MLDEYAWYTADYISRVMSLRKPQRRSMEILDDVFMSINPQKDMDLTSALKNVHDKYPICSNFERQFPSLTFALATGVGKTRLMGAFIAYLYTNHEIKNFFIVAPNMTIYEKIKREFSDPNHPKYVFKGLGCFVTPPNIVTDDDYRNKTLPLVSTEVTLYIFNIDKFNKEDSNMRHISEYIGDSFYHKLSQCPDLVLIMDESHHYRAERGAAALNELKPILGLELTATPMVTKNSKQVPFKNVVYEYPLSQAIADGYTRTPYALTRSNIDCRSFGDERLDKIMLQDGIEMHQRTKRRLEAYAFNNHCPAVKPFMLVVCKDTDHATWVEQYIKSDEFCSGAYRDKMIVVHSKLKGTESDENTRLLLSVERPDNPIEIIVHVNMLKEGWDVNNLYTIVPLRTAASKVLREQMVGRGLRLPYGVRTGDKEVDSVVLTAHNNFEDIIREAQQGDSLFKAGNIIKAEEIESEKTAVTQLKLDLTDDTPTDVAFTQYGIQRTKQSEALIQKVNQLIAQQASQPKPKFDPKAIKDIIAADNEYGDLFKNEQDQYAHFIEQEAAKRFLKYKEKFIPIPQITVTDAGVEELLFRDFDLNYQLFDRFAPISNELLLQNLIESGERERLSGSSISLDDYNPQYEIAILLRDTPEVNYMRDHDLIVKLVTGTCTYFQMKFSLDDMKQIVMLHKKEIVEIIVRQMLRHSERKTGLIQEDVLNVQESNLSSYCTYSQKLNLYDDNFTVNIRSVLFDGIEKGVFEQASFDSRPELIFARLAERDRSVQKWLRPAPLQFKLKYNNSHYYRPDFVVEMADCIYLVEIKGEDKIDNAEVQAKCKRAVTYCDVVTRWNQANGYKPWKHLFIPSQQVNENSTFDYMTSQFVVTK